MDIFFHITTWSKSIQNNQLKLYMSLYKKLDKEALLKYIKRNLSLPAI
jgi:hypothetical protein